MAAAQATGGPASGKSFNLRARSMLKKEISNIDLNEGAVFDYAPVVAEDVSAGRSMRNIARSTVRTLLPSVMEAEPTPPPQAAGYMPPPCAKCKDIADVEERCKPCRKAVAKARRDERRARGLAQESMLKKLTSKIVSRVMLQPAKSKSKVKLAEDDIANLPEDEAEDLYLNQTDQVKAIVEALEPFFFRKAGGDRYEPWGRAKLAASIRSQVDAGLEIAFVMLAFPFKFHNKMADVGKVIGDEADLSEAAAILRLTQVCDAVSAVYPPGARLIVMSDGVLWNDLFDVDDETMWRYRDKCAEMAKIAGGRVVMAGLDLYFPQEMSPAAIRHELFSRYRPTLASVKENRSRDENAKQSFTDFQTFLTFHFEPSGVFPSMEQVRKAARLVGVEMLSREAALIGFMKDLIPGTIRLSIRPKTMDSNAYTVNMLGQVQLEVAASNPAAAALATPWHNAGVVSKQVYKDGSGIYLMRTRALEDGTVDKWEEMQRVVGFVEKGADKDKLDPVAKAKLMVTAVPSGGDAVDSELMAELQGLGAKLLSGDVGKPLPKMPGTPGTPVFAYKELKGDVNQARADADNKLLAKGMAPWAKEQHLNDEEFVEQLGITRKEFNDLLTCQQLMYKRKAKLLG